MCYHSQRKYTTTQRKIQKSQILGHFGPKFAPKLFFWKSGLVSFLDITILHHCAKFHEKMSTTAREIQEIPFFRQFLESSGCKNQFYWQLNHAWSWVLLSIMFLYEKTRKSPMKIYKKSDFRHISGIFGRKKIFLKNQT